MITTNEYTVVSMFVNPNILNFDLSLCPILIPPFQPFVAGCDKSGTDHMAGELASPTAQITLSSIKLHLSITEVNCINALLNETLLQ